MNRILQYVSSLSIGRSLFLIAWCYWLGYVVGQLIKNISIDFL